MRERKDSGVEWIGAVPSDYGTASIGSLFAIKKDIIGQEPETVLSITQTGIRPKDLSSNEGQNASSYAHYQIVNIGDFAMNHMDLLTGWIDISKYEGVTSPDYRVFTLNDKEMSAEYFLRVFQYYYTNRVFYGFGQGVATFGRWRLPAINFKKIDVPVPPVTEQQRIVVEIDKNIRKVDALIANVRAQIEKLKAYKQSVITEVVTKGLDPTVPMKDSGVEWIGEIPEHWRVVKTGRLFKENNRRPFGGDTPLSLSQIDGLIATDDMKESSLKTSTYENWKRVELGDLVLNRFKAHLGVLFAATLTGIVSFHYGVYEAKRPLVPKFYEYLYHADQYRAILGNASNGMVVGLQNLSNLNFYSTYSLFPAYEEQEMIATYLDKKCSQIDRLIALKQSKIEKLEQYKKSLIYEYVTGKKEVS